MKTLPLVLGLIVGMVVLTPASRAGMLSQQIYFTYATRRGWHPMMGGIGRRSGRAARRQAVGDAEAAALFLGAPVEAGY